VFNSVRAVDFNSINETEKKVEALRNLLWGLSVAAGTLGALVAMGFGAWRTWNDARRTHTERRKLETETFATAIEQLGKSEMKEFAIRLGAILNLETLAKSSPRLHPVIMEAFCAYLREKRAKPIPLLDAVDAKAPDEDAPGQERVEAARERVQKIRAAVSALDKFPEDLQAIVTALGRRTVAYDRPEWRLDLRGVNLRKVDLQRGHFEGANLQDAHLERGDLTNGFFRGAILEDAHLEGAFLGGAHLEGTALSGAHLENAGLVLARLEGAKLIGAYLEHATLRSAGLASTYLWWACLDGADLRGAHLEGANLEDAYLDGADLRDMDITQAQLDSAHGDAHTEIPDHLTRPAHWGKTPPTEDPASDHDDTDPDPPA
jgi:uncharacterized protein YjbI with pentapeptide repeats